MGLAKYMYLVIYIVPLATNTFRYLHASLVLELTGIKPATFRMQSGRSATELQPLLFIILGQQIFRVLHPSRVGTVLVNRKKFDSEEIQTLALKEQWISNPSS